MKYRLVFAVVLFLLPSPLFAWGHKEHIQLTRMAVCRLIADPATPEAMKAWLRQITPNVYDQKQEEQFFLTGKIGDTKDGAGLNGIEYWTIAPDLFVADKGARIPPYNAPERPLHFIDLELLLPPAEKKGYRHDLSGKPKMEAIPRDVTDERYRQAGFLPFRLEESYQKLVAAIRAQNLAPPDISSREVRDDAQRWAGFLAHYIADNTQPHHATVDYQSKTYFANKNRPPNVHAEMEYRMNDDAAEDYMDLRKAFWPQFVKELETVQDPAQTKDLWRGTLEVSFISYDALPLIGLAAMKAANQGGTPEEPKGQHGPFDTRVFFNYPGQYLGKEMSVSEMKAHQQAWAVVRIQKLLRQAWDEGTGQ